MPEENLKSEIAQERPRDADGHFVHVDPNAPPPNIPQAAADYIESHTHPTGKDDLLDVHVGNPLERIEKILLDIKKQKAFSFTLKGSLGLAGVALALGLFGVFGGNQLLCSHGTQTFQGIVRTLNYNESPRSTTPFIGPFLDKISPQAGKQRKILIRDNKEILDLPFSQSIDLGPFEAYHVLVTGSYNSCSQTLSVTDPSGVEFSQ